MSFFKAYDMRGTFGVDFDLEKIRQIGATLPSVVGGSRWLVGRDCRTTSPAVHEALVAGLCQAGADVYDLGLCTTPMVYFFTAQDDFDGSVMITASHNPPTDNGLKVSRRGALPVGYADGLDEVERRLNAHDVPQSKTVGSVYDVRDALPRYLAWMRAQTADAEVDALNVAIDCSNGMASLLAHELFPQAHFLNDVCDGTFPAHSPNPLKEEARAQLAAYVREHHLDCGIIFDGDADRAMFVDERGIFVQPDYLIPVVAEASRCAQFKRCGRCVGGMTVVHDVRTSRGAIEALCEMGAVPRMVPVGHAFAKPVLRETGALCGGELAGHYYFGEFFGCDSGILAALRIAGAVARAKAQGLTFSQMMNPIISRYANSGELNFKVDDKDAAIARVLADAHDKLPVEISRSTMDGIRLEYETGWVNIRKSNTEPYLRLIVECDTPARLGAWVDALTDAIRA